MTVTPLLIAAVLFVTLVLLVTTVAVLREDAAHRAQLLAAVDAQSSWRDGIIQRLDEKARRTRPGARVSALLAGSGLPGWSPTLFMLGTAAAASLTGLLTSMVAGTATALIAAALVVGGARQWLARRRGQRVEQFIGQLPELARLLANGAQAGLGVHNSIELAGNEMAEPARAELRQVASELAVGRSLDHALRNLAERLPSRELVVLVQTLIIQARAGGALVTALQNIAATLDQRRQLRREAKTAVVGAQFSGFTVALLGGGSVLLMNVFSPGALDAMLGSFAGRIVVTLAGTLFGIGFVLMRRLTKVDI